MQKVEFLKQILKKNDKNVLILKWYLMEISRKYMPNILQHFFKKLKADFHKNWKKEKQNHNAIVLVIYLWL